MEAVGSLLELVVSCVISCSSSPQQSSLVTGQLAELNVPRKHKWSYQTVHDTLRFK